jgi:NAD(P)-dependent dehydrogenase (short-subunit alcohol dehydrogenase family)
MAAIPRNILAVIGTGGMGLACARHLASGRKLLLADYTAEIVERSVKSLQNDGHAVEGHVVNVKDFATVKKFAEIAGKAGHIDAIIHTAGVSPVQAPVRQIFEVDLLGGANVIEAFLPVASAGTSLVFISSMAGYMHLQASPDLERHLATAPLDQLLHHKEIEAIQANEDYAAKGEAYGLSKRANHLRVQAAAQAWGSKGARVNTVSPGIISTPMGRAEIDGPNPMVRGLIGLSPMKRVGTSEDIANVVAFLAGSESSFITGTDILIDGGVTSSMRWSSEK